MTDNYQEIHPVWPDQPPEIKDSLPEVASEPKLRKKLCPKYYHQCWKLECHDSVIPSGQCVD